MNIESSLVDLFESEVSDDGDNDDGAPSLLQLSPYYNNEECIQLLQSKKDVLKILSLNCQSLNAKFEELNIYMEVMNTNSCAFEVICLQETWLSENSDTSHLGLDGYQFFHKGKSCSTHGGVAFFVKEELSCKVLSITSASNIWDGIFIEVTISLDENTNLEKKIIIGNIYRPPRNILDNYINFNDELDEILTNLQRTRQEVVIVGDFNIDLMKIRENHHADDFFQVIMSNGFVPRITLPTRLSHSSSTLIDNIFVKLSNNFCEATAGILMNNISDHQPCFITLDYLKLRQRKSRYIKIHTGDPRSINCFKQEIKEKCALDCFMLDISDDPNKNYDKLNNIITTAINTHLPTKVVKFNKYKHKKNKWITFGIIKSIKERDKLHKNLKSTDRLSGNYNTLKNHLANYNRLLKQNIRNAKKLYYEDCFSKFQNDIRKTWHMISNVINQSALKINDFPTHFAVNGQLISDPKKIANEFNDYYINIGKNMAANITSPQGKKIEDYLQSPADHNFHFQRTNAAEILRTIETLKPKTSKGVDGLSNKLLIEVKNELAPCLAALINESLEKGIFPDKLKCAKVIPIYKKNENTLINNYRPVSILPSISKVYEKVIHNQIYTHFMEQKLFYRSQYGFLPQRSTELAALELIDRIIDKMDSKEIPINIYLDLSKAFDTLDHDILLHKLKYYGIRGHSLQLFRSYLENRSQFVAFKDVHSDIVNITTGVPQGSIIGPLLFLIYINDIKNASTCFIPVIYADDTTLTSTLSFAGSTDQELTVDEVLNKELKNVADWLKVNKLSLNVDKTKAMLFHVPQKRVSIPSIRIDNFEISFVNEFNFLGIILDKGINWKSHLDHITRKLSKAIGVLNRLKRFLPQKALLLIHNALVLPHINYGILLWGWKAERLVKLQKKLVRIISNASYNAHSEPLFKNLKILKATHASMLHDYKFCYKLHNCTLPDYFLDSLFHRNDEVHNYRTRNSRLYQLPRVRHTFAKNNIRFRIPNNFNNAPKNIIEKVSTHSLPGFIHYVKNYYLNQYSSVCNERNCFSCRR